MVETIQVANIFSIILDESLSTTQQVLAVFKAELHHSFIEHVKSTGLIVQSKEIKVAVFNQINKTQIIKEDIRTKKSQGRVIYEKRAMAMTNMTVCSTR